MQTRVVDKPAFTLAGLAVATSQANQAADAGARGQPPQVGIYIPATLG